MSLEMKWREKIDRTDNLRELTFPLKRNQFTNKQINAYIKEETYSNILDILH